MEASKKAYDLIKKYEGFRNHPYVCPAGIPTIGYGTTFYPDGTAVELDDEPITIRQATDILKTMVCKYEAGVNDLVKVELNQNQFDALVVFTYNVGLRNFEESTLLKKINNNPEDDSICSEFKKWVYAAGIKLKGLKKRRNEEAYLYSTPM